MSAVTDRLAASIATVCATAAPEPNAASAAAARAKRIFGPSITSRRYAAIRRACKMHSTGGPGAFRFEAPGRTARLGGMSIFSSTRAAPHSSASASASSRAPVPGRACGSCTLCCKTMGVDELAKPPGVWCQHCLTLQRMRDLQFAARRLPRVLLRVDAVGQAWARVEAGPGQVCADGDRPQGISRRASIRACPRHGGGRPITRPCRGGRASSPKTRPRRGRGSTCGSGGAASSSCRMARRTSGSSRRTKPCGSSARRRIPARSMSRRSSRCPPPARRTRPMPPPIEAFGRSPFGRWLRKFGVRRDR